MEESNNNNQNQSQSNLNNSTINNTAYNNYNPYVTSYPDPFEVNWNTEMTNILRDIRSNTERQIRINRDGNYTNFAIVFLVLIFMAYMFVGFYQSDGFNYSIPCKLLGMIMAIFVMVVLLHRYEVNVLEDLNKNK